MKHALPQTIENPSRHQTDCDGPGSVEHGRQVANTLIENMLKEQRPVLHQQPQLTIPAFQPRSNDLPFPPGFAGHLAKQIFQSSYLSVREVAIAASLGVLAGICGRAFETPTGKDLALFIILVGRSGTGKDTIHESIHSLIKNANLDAASYFVRSQDFASGPALHKELLARPGFLNLQGEFGRRLKAMSILNNAPMQELRTTMTNCYAKDFLAGKSYSDADKSLQGVKWPSLSFLGETTPETFAEALTPDMMEDGFMSRFLVINYNGLRPAPNHNRERLVFSPQVLEHWRMLISRALPYQGTANTPASRIAVEFLHEDVSEKLRHFELECGDHINQTEDESERQVWNRAHLKALKIACLLAVADNPIMPKVDLGHATWAITLVRADISSFNAKKKNGEIGNSDDTRVRKLWALITKYVTEQPAPSYKISEDMRNAGVVPRSYLQVQISKHSAFNNHKLGQSAALDSTLRSMIASGYLNEVSKVDAVERYGTYGRCFRILQIPA